MLPIVVRSATGEIRKTLDRKNSTNFPDDAAFYASICVICEARGRSR